MRQESLRNRIINYLKKRSYFVASGDIQRLALENGYYSPSNASRRLRELAEEGLLEVEYRKGHAYYKYNEENTNKISERDGGRPVLSEMLHNRPDEECSKDRLASQFDLWGTTSK